MRIEASDPAMQSRLVDVLRSGGVVVMPCDTMYGFVGVAPDTEARIRALKGREEKSFLQLIPSSDWLQRFTDFTLPEPLAAAANRLWSASRISPPISVRPWT